MSFVVALILSMIFLEWPWRLLVLVPAALLELGEIFLWLRWRRVRSITGAESMVGSTGVALTDCRPEGQVRVRGQLWKATCPQNVAAGEGVVVTGVNGIALVVRPQAAATAESRV